MPAQFSYMVQQPDGSVATLQSEAERPPTWGELADHVASTGAQLLPATPAQQPAREQISAPPPARLPPATAFISNPPEAATGAPGWQAAVSRMPTATPSLTEQAVNVVNPQRSFASQLPSAGMAVLGGETGAALGMLGGPAAPVTIPLGAVAGAALASGGTEAAQIALERAMGWQPAEAGTFGQRVGGAAIRGGAFEALPDLARFGIKMGLSPLQALTHAAGWLVGLPRAAEVANPWLPAVSNTLQRVGSQLVGATPIWPGATTLTGPPPPGYATPSR